jgi:hypothetical protein
VDLDPKDNVDASTHRNLGTSSETNVDTFSSDRNVDTRLENQMQASHDSDDCDSSSDTSISYDTDETDLLESVLKNAINQNLIDRLLGCAYGQALGDAYGLSTEFEDRDDVKHNYPDQSKLIPFPNYVLTGHSRRWTRGDWTDDTDQWILVLETLTEHDGDVTVFAEKLSNWIRNGYPELGDHGGMGLGANVSQVILFSSKDFVQLDEREKIIRNLKYHNDSIIFSFVNHWIYNIFIALEFLFLFHNRSFILMVILPIHSRPVEMYGNAAIVKQHLTELLCDVQHRLSSISMI